MRQIYQAGAGGHGLIGGRVMRKIAAGAVPVQKPLPGAGVCISVPVIIAGCFSVCGDASGRIVRRSGQCIEVLDWVDSAAGVPRRAGGGVRIAHHSIAWNHVVVWRIAAHLVRHEVGTAIIRVSG